METCFWIVNVFLGKRYIFTSNEYNKNKWFQMVQTSFRIALRRTLTSIIPKISFSKDSQITILRDKQVFTIIFSIFF